MITIQFPHNLPDSDMELIDELRQEQSVAVRMAYVAASKGLREKEIRESITSRLKSSDYNLIDSWFIQSGLRKGIGDAKADKELKVSSRTYGGKGNLIRRAKSLITNEEWKQKRLLPLYIVGEAPQKGNRKFNFFVDNIIFKPFKGKKITIQVPNLHKNRRNLYNKAILSAENKELSITISIDSENINITFDDNKSAPKLNRNKSMYAGIDLNPNYIGVSILKEEKVIDYRLFDFKSLTGKTSNDNKLKHEVIEVAHDIGKWLRHKKVSNVFVEELSFKQGNTGFSKNFNRLVINKWKRNKFNSILSKYYKIIKVNAAYSSTIGNVLNPCYPDPIAASIEIARRGFEIVIKKSKKFYPDLPPLKYLEDLWKEPKIPDAKNWKDLHDFLKKSGLRYRIPLPSEGSFRIFRSNASLVRLYGFMV